LLLPRRLRPVGPEEPAPRAVGSLQRAGPPRRERPRLPDLELDRARRLAVHRAREPALAEPLLRPPARGGPAARAAGPGHPDHAPTRWRDDRAAVGALPDGRGY